MNDVSVTELRQNLAHYVARVQAGETVRIVVHGQIVGRIEPERNSKAAARKRLAQLRKTAHLGDLISPIDTEWNATKGILVQRPRRKRA